MQGRPFFYFAYGAAVSEVVVDTLTGEWKLLRADMLHDAGKSLNPAIDIGQVEGGFIQGMGWLTTEELVWHPQQGPADDARAEHLQDPDRQRLPAACSTCACSTARQRRADTIHRSKAVGEPPLLLPFSVFFAIRDAVSAAGGHRVDPPLARRRRPRRSCARSTRACSAGERGARDASAAVRSTALARAALAAAPGRAAVRRRRRRRGARLGAARGRHAHARRRRRAAGTIGGGHLELKAIAAARAMLAGGDAAPRAASTSRSARRSASAAAAR